MGRTKNPVGTVTVTVSVTPEIYDLLGKVAKTGLGARTEASVAEEMIRKGLNSDGLLSDLVRKRIAESDKTK